MIESLTSIVNQIKIGNGYIPNDHKQQNEYDVFASKKDTKGMIATKLSKLCWLSITFIQCIGCFFILKKLF